MERGSAVVDSLGIERPIRFPFGNQELDGTPAGPEDLLPSPCPQGKNGGQLYGNALEAVPGICMGTPSEASSPIRELTDEDETGNCDTELDEAD